MITPFAVEKDVMKWRHVKESDLPKNGDCQKFTDGDVWALERNYEGAIEMAITRRSFCITQAGRMGLCNPKAQHGDEVWVSFGSRVPFVLRRAERWGPTVGGTYQFIGNCFLSSAIDGVTER